MIYLAQNNIGGDMTDIIQKLPNCSSWDSLQELRVCLAELHAVPDPKNQLRSKIFQPNTTSCNSSTVDLLKKRVEQAPTPWFWWSTSGGAPPTLSFLQLG
jgi:hypothetical protein